MPTRNHSSKNQPKWIQLFGVACLVASVYWFTSAYMHVMVAYADVPAVTDFGQNSVQAVMKTHDEASKSASRAVFMTLYADGHGQVEFCSVHNDAVASFAGDHPAWKLDEGLRWFMQMPVYVKHVSSQPAPYGEHVLV